ncbi:MAG TPA: S9 family peptidase [Candidatus Eremiobacteraceae bacterium]|nr:S9 family peptidase [Candidatus Eremiobacteraceae bacterium]
MRLKSCLFILLLSVLPATASAKTFDEAAMRSLVGIFDPQISPDGKQIAVVGAHADYDKDTYRTDIMLVDVATGASRTVTDGRDGVGSPRWSPSGDKLAFVSLAGDPPDEEEQVWVMPLDGGDALQVTHAKNGVEQFAWRPDGAQIAYVSPDSQPNAPAIKDHRDEFVVTDNAYLDRSASVPSHLWLVNSDGSSDHRLTSGSWSVPASEPPGPPGSPLSWSPDGSHITITRLESPVYGDNDRSTIEIVDAKTGAARKLSSHTMWEGFPEYSPDGTSIAYDYPHDGDPLNIQSIWVAPAAGGDGVEATKALDRHIVRAIWMPGSKALLVAAHDGTDAAMWIQPLSGTATRIATGDVQPSQAFWLDADVGRDGAIAFTGSKQNDPTELWYMASPTSTPKRLTDVNAPDDAIDYGRMSAIQWQGPDGFQEDGVLTYPPGFVAAKKYPLVLNIHGGPNSASITSFGPLTQLLAARGWLVFSPNYRGSDDLGNAYWRAIFNDAGDGPGRDVMAGVDAVEKLGIVDESKIAVSGWSYGGYMTSWLEGHYSIWKVAVAGAAVNNLVDEYALSDNNVGVRYGFPDLSSPWTHGSMAAYLAQSPLTYASKIKAPTLIMSDVGDTRVPITQSYEMYHALKENGVPVDFWAYPVYGHSPGDPVRRDDVYQRWISWIADHFGQSSSASAGGGS